MNTTITPIDRAMEIAKRFKETNDEVLLKKEYIANGGSERTFERDLAGARKIEQWKNEEIDKFKKAIKNEMWAKIADKNSDGVAKTIEMIIDMACGDYYNEATKLTKEGPVTYKVKISDKGRQNSMKLLAEYTELFDSVMKNHAELFGNMTESLHEIKNNEKNPPIRQIR